MMAFAYWALTVTLVWIAMFVAVKASSNFYGSSAWETYREVIVE
jgi:hypothetical protein